MFEWLPVLGGIILGTGAAFFSRAFGRRSVLVVVMAIGVIVAFVATVSSGEASESWAYLAVDLLETAIGFSLGFLSTWLLRKPSPR